MLSFDLVSMEARLYSCRQLAEQSYVHRHKVDGAFLLLPIGHCPFALEEKWRKLK
jgi:hypothetical protein